MNGLTVIPLGTDELRKGLARNELVFYYQPKVSFVTGKVCGAEALIRWIRPNGSLVPPGEFIPYAEETGFVTEISRAMFPKLVADMEILNDMEAPITVSFNLSAKDFMNRDMLKLIRAAIDSHQIQADKLQAELTEAAIIDNNENIRAALDELVKMGVRLAMDDYGTGYSSIDTLSQWPFSIVKLDQGMIRRMLKSEKCTTIVESTIHMAHYLGIDVVAEGVETSAIYDFLLRSGCTEAQGYWLAKPMPLSEFLSFIKYGHSWSVLPAGLIHMAQLDHLHWRKTLVYQITNLAFNHLEQQTVQGLTVEMNHHHCHLGKWYYGLGQEFKCLPAFDALEQPHRLLHQHRARMVILAKNGRPKDEITRGLQELTRLSSIVLGLLQELEDQALF